VQVSDPLGIVHRTLRVHVIFGGPAVLGDVQRQVRGILRQAHQQFVEPVRIDEPAHRRPLEPARTVLDNARYSASGHEFVAPQIVRIARPQVYRRVVIDPDEIDRRADRLHVAGRDQRRRRDETGRRLRRVAAAQDRLEIQTVQRGVGDRSRLLKALRPALAKHLDRMQVERQPDPAAAGQNVAQCAHGKAVSQQQMMGGGGGSGVIGDARGVLPGSVAMVCSYLRLVHRDPLGYPVAQRGSDHSGVLREALGGVARRPASRVLKLLGKIPVIQRHRRRDAALAELVDQ
jgi:hypothetical protein